MNENKNNKKETTNNNVNHYNNIRISDMLEGDSLKIWHEGNLLLHKYGEITLLYDDMFLVKRYPDNDIYITASFKTVLDFLYHKKDL